MIRKGVLLLLFLGVSGPSFGGWLSDAVSGAVKKVGEKAIEETTGGAYEGLKRKAGETIESSPDTSSKMKNQVAPAPDTSAKNEASIPPSPRFTSEIASIPKKKKVSASTVNFPHFSARLLSYDPEEEEETVTRMYAGGSRMRMEPVSGGEDQGISIIDFAGEMLYMLSTEEKTYLEFPYGDEDENQMDYGFLVGKNPCTEYRVSKKEGSETLHGRRTVKWVCSEPEDEFEAETTTIWMDQELNLPLRTEDSDGFISEISEIKTESQPAHLFEIPAGYEKVSMPFPLFGAAPRAQTGEPYAPKPEIPGNPPEDATKKAEYDLEILMLRSLQVPPKNEVGIPAYPGAKALKYMPASKGSINDEPFVSLPVIEIITVDDPETVAAWYRNNLPGWSEKEFLQNTYFWGGGNFHPLKVSGMETPHVGVLEIPRRVLTYFSMPEAKTTIQIRYRPRN